MNTCLQYRKPTREEVLELLREEHEVQVACLEANPTEIELTTSVKAWQCCMAVNSTTFVTNVQRLNRLFDLKVKPRDWAPILKPARRRTLADICDFVATRASVAQIGEPKFLGRPCRTAGTFLAIREMMNHAGVDTTALRPSSRLEEFSKNGLPQIALPILRLAPRLIHKIRFNYPSDFVYCVVGFFLFISTMFTGVIAFGIISSLIPVTLIPLAGFIYIWRQSIRHRDNEQTVTIEGMNDFRDLCRALAESDPLQHSANRM